MLTCVLADLRAQHQLLLYHEGSVEYVFAFISRDEASGSAQFFGKLGFVDPSVFHLQPYDQDLTRDYNASHWRCQRFPDLIAMINSLCPRVRKGLQVRFVSYIL